MKLVTQYKTPPMLIGKRTSFTTKLLQELYDKGEISTISQLLVLGNLEIKEISKPPFFRLSPIRR